MDPTPYTDDYHGLVLLDHKMIIEGVQYHEKMEKFLNEEDGAEKYTLSLSFSIGDRTYTKIGKFADGKVENQTTETNLIENEVAAFKKLWVENWHPMICPYFNTKGIKKTTFL